MKMKTAAIAALLTSILCSTAQAQHDDLHAACAASFTNEGSFFRGHTYRAHVDIPSVAYDEAFRRIGQAVAADGWSGVQGSRDLGTINATQEVAGNAASSAPLNIIVQDRGANGISADANFSIHMGQVAPADRVRDDLCNLLIAGAG